MIRNLVSFILRSRLENVIAAAVSIALLALFLTTRMFRTFAFGMHDFIFILLPISILGPCHPHRSHLPPRPANTLSRAAATVRRCRAHRTPKGQARAHTLDHSHALHELN